MKSTSGAIPADLLTASMAASHFPTCIRRGGGWLGFKQTITFTEDELARTARCFDEVSAGLNLK